MSLKAIMMDDRCFILSSRWRKFEDSSYSHRSVFQSIFFCQNKAFYEDVYNKINKLSNFKFNLVSLITRIRDTSIELGLKYSISGLFKI